jgi:hypothetical protein
MRLQPCISIQYPNILWKRPMPNGTEGGLCPGPTAYPLKILDMGFREFPFSDSR